MNAYPTCADWTDLDKEVARVSKELMEDIDRMIWLRRMITDRENRVEFMNASVLHPLDKFVQKGMINYYVRQIETWENEYAHLKKQRNCTLYNLASYRLQNYYTNHHIDPSIL